MIVALLLKFWKQIAGVILLSAVLFTAYSYVENIGYTKATVEYTRQMKDFNDKLDRRIDNLEKNSAALIDASIANKEQAAKDFKTILQAAKNKPLYTIQNNVCAPSIDFINTYNEAINRANKK